jgi:hypothetical protein
MTQEDLAELQAGHASLPGRVEVQPRADESVLVASYWSSLHEHAWAFELEHCRAVARVSGAARLCG